MSRYESEKRRYQPTARRITSGSNCRHLKRPQTEEARRSIRPTYHGVTPKLQHFPLAILCGFPAVSFWSFDRRLAAKEKTILKNIPRFKAANLGTGEITSMLI